LVLVVVFNVGYSQIILDSTDPGEDHINRLATIDTFRFSYINANPKAKKLMKEDFFWDPIAETGPFGSDDGSDAAYGFRKWIASNKGADPLIYLRHLIIVWGYPYFDLVELDAAKINEYMKADKNMGASYLLGQDNAIIGTAFAQLSLEGQVTPDLKRLTVTAIQRELLPLLIDRWNVEYRKTRRTQLNKMLDVIRKCDSE